MKLLVVILLVCSASSAQEIEFGLPVRVDDDTTDMNQRSPRLAVDVWGNLYSIWIDVREINAAIYFAKSTDGGESWSTNVRIDYMDSWQGSPDMAVDSTANLYCVFGDSRGGRYNIYFTMSTDGGDSWTSPSIKVNDEAPGGCYEPQLAVDGNGIYVIWTDTRNGDDDIYFAMSTDYGNTWTEPNAKVNDVFEASQFSEDIASDGGGVLYVTYADITPNPDVVLFTKSTDGGNTWSPSVVVNDPWRVNSGYSCIAVRKGMLYVVWEDDHEDIYFARSTDGGSNWTMPSCRISDPATGNQRSPCLALDNRNIYTAWKRREPDDYHIYFAMSTDDGFSWTSPNVKVDKDLLGTADPALAVKDGSVYVAFDGQPLDTTSLNIYFAKATGLNVEEEAISTEPEPLRLGIYPNPSSGKMLITYQLPEATFVSLTIHDCTGRLRRVVADGKRIAGRHTVLWDGEGDWGREAASGIYFLSFQAGGERKVKKLIRFR